MPSLLSEENVAISASLDVPCTIYPFPSNNFDRYAPSWPEIPKIKATLLIIKSKISSSFNDYISIQFNKFKVKLNYGNILLVF